jgi:hypothetical protein
MNMTKLIQDTQIIFFKKPKNLSCGSPQTSRAFFYENAKKHVKIQGSIHTTSWTDRQKNNFAHFFLSQEMK